MKSQTLLQGMAGTFCLAALAAAGSVQARGEWYPDSYLSVYGGVSTATDKVGNHDDFYDYYNGYYNENSATGGSFGASARFNLAPGLILDADYTHDQASFSDLDLTRSEFQVGLGYLGPIGRYSSWFVEGVYGHVEFPVNSASLCGGDCVTESHDGGGVKAGFIWPFADRWYASVEGGYLSMDAHNGFDGVGEALLNGAVGFKFNPNLSVGVRTDFAAFVDKTDTSYETDFDSWRVFVSYHF